MGQAVPRIFRCFQSTALLLLLAVAALGSEPLTNEIIIKMVRAGVPTETVIRTIQSAESFRFGTLPGDLMQLQQANVPEDIIRALAARINWPGTPPLVIAHPVSMPEPAAAPQKPSKGKTAPAKSRQPLPGLFPAPPTATASIGPTVAAPTAAARPAANSFASTGRGLRHWSWTPFRFLRRLFRR